MWCLSPAGPYHARHVAVEFVHPVIVGKRALSCCAVDDTAALRALVTAGDVVLAVGPGVEDVLRRAPAWGATTVWIGEGDGRAADHLLRAGGDDVVALYHVLWELTHVCLDHPGLMDTQPVGDRTACVTCSDEGRLGEVLETGDLLRVRTARGVETVDGSLVDPLRPGDVVLVHAGTVIAVP
ncbi:MAG: hydrogenase assembly protein HupF [Acidimicrobiales bacterium]